MPQQTRNPPYDLSHPTRLRTGGAAVNVLAEPIVGTISANVVAGGSGGAGSGIGTASVGILEIGPPAQPATLNVEADVTYDFSWQLDVHGWTASVEGGFSLTVESIPVGEEESSPGLQIFKATSKWTDEKDSDQGKKATLSVSMQIDPQHTYKAFVTATAYAVGAGTTYHNPFGWGRLAWLTGSLAIAELHGTVNQFRLSW